MIVTAFDFEDHYQGRRAIFRKFSRFIDFCLVGHNLLVTSRRYLQEKLLRLLSGLSVVNNVRKPANSSENQQSITKTSEFFRKPAKCHEKQQILYLPI